MSDIKEGNSAFSVEPSLEELAEKHNISESLLQALSRKRDRQFVVKLENVLLEFIESNM